MEWIFGSQRKLKKKAHVLSDGLVEEIVVRQATALSEDLVKMGYPIHPSHKVVLGMELLLVYFYCVDSIAFDALGAKRRATLMDALFAAVLAELIGRSFEHAAWFQKAYNRRLHQYAQCGGFAARHDEPVEGTVIWEAASNISQELLGDRTACAPISIMVGDSVLRLLKKQMVAEFLNG